MDQASRKAFARTVYREIRSSLPSPSRLKQNVLEDAPLDFEPEGIFINSSSKASRIRIWERLLGLTLWFFWFSAGIYFWWFKSIPVSDYIIGFIVWALIFMFSILGIPITRAMLEISNKA